MERLLGLRVKWKWVGRQAKHTCGERWRAPRRIILAAAGAAVMGEVWQQYPRTSRLICSLNQAPERTTWGGRSRLRSGARGRRTKDRPGSSPGRAACGPLCTRTRRGARHPTVCARPRAQRGTWAARRQRWARRYGGRARRRPVLHLARRRRVVLTTRNGRRRSRGVGAEGTEDTEGTPGKVGREDECGGEAKEAPWCRGGRDRRAAPRARHFTSWWAASGRPNRGARRPASIRGFMEVCRTHSLR